MRGGDSRVWTPPRVAQSQGNPAHCCLLGAGWGPRLEQRMPRFSAQAGDGVMEKGGRVYTEGRGAAGGEQPTRAALFQALEPVGQQGDAPPPPSGSPLHPCPPLNSTSALREAALYGPLSPSQPHLCLRWHLGRREVFSPSRRSPKEPSIWVPSLGCSFTHCTTFFHSLVPSSTPDLRPSPSLPSQGR